MDGVLSKVELAALPCGTTENSAAGGTQAAVIVRCNELHASQAARDQTFEERRIRKPGGLFSRTRQ